MREILFKAKTKLIVGTYNCGKEDGEWVIGCLYCDTGKWIIRQFEFDRADYVPYEVDPETICQYTNLKDKCGDGKRVYEGDICEFSVFDYNGHDTQYKGVVVYSGSRFMLWNSRESEYYGDDGGFDLDWITAQDDEFAVIGNIFDNPEPLKEDTENANTSN